MDLNEKIINHLIFYSPYMEDIGLFYGKMGISIFFYEYGSYVGNRVFFDLGYKLLNDIWNKISIKYPFHFDTGLCGIGWGIEYLIQNDFIQGDGNEICEEIDKQIMQINLKRLEDDSVETGFKGVCLYLSSRLHGAIIKNRKMPFDVDFLQELSQCDPCFNSEKFMEARNKYPLLLNQFLNEEFPIDISVLLNNRLGLKKGLSGFLLKQMSRV